MLDGAKQLSSVDVEEGQYQACMFSATDLSLDEEHEVVLTNIGPSGWFVDLDYVVVTDGNGNSQ